MDCQARGTKVRIIHHRETLYHNSSLTLPKKHPGTGQFHKKVSYLPVFHAPTTFSITLPVYTSDMEWMSGTRFLHHSRAFLS
jgi:hypothetical protein